MMNQDRLYNLLAREQAGELTTEEAAQLQQLLQQYPEASYIREVLTRDWASSGKQYDSQQLQNLLAKHQQRVSEAAATTAVEEPVAPKRTRWLMYAGIAASVIVVIALMRYWPRSYKQLEHDDLALHTTAKGTRSQLTLPDGSKVWLNAGSRLTYPKQFAPGASRKVTLQGEAFFVVTPDANRPFFVHTNAIHIRVLGTSFNVRAYPQEDSAETSLVQGSIEVALDEKGEQVIALRPNEKLTVPVRPLHASSKGPQAAAPEVLRVYKSRLIPVRDSILTETAWVQNKLAFRHLQLEKVAEMLEDWYDIEIGFKNEKKKQLYFTGVFDNENLDQVMNALETTLSFRWSRDTTGKIWIR